jgi:hypothetical protein
MKQPLFYFSLLLSQLCSAQGYRNEKITFLNEDGIPCKEKVAIFLEQQVQVNDTIWEFNSYLANGPRIKSLRTLDEKGKTWNGTYISYSRRGGIDTMGYYAKGQRAGKWFVYTAGGRVLKALYYDNGRFKGQKDSTRLNGESDSISRVSLSDSAKVVERESEFAGGANGWMHYLNTNMKYPDRAVDHEVQGKPTLLFLVDATGHIPLEDIHVLQSVEFSIDKEALRLIIQSPNWTPAFQNGKNVKSYKKQPFIFKLTAR